MNSISINRAASPQPLALAGLVTILLSATARAERFTQEDVTIFEPPPGSSQGIFPGVDLNVFKQYVVGIDVSETVGASFEIDLLFDTLEFGGELGAGLKADFGVEVGFCFGGQADFEMAFQPSVTIPDKFPYDFPIPLTVDEGRLDSSYFATSFGAPQAYADLIFDLNAFLRARACIGYCVDLPFPELRTRDLPAPFDLFKESTRCDPFLDEQKYFGIELAALNRGNDGKLRFLNVAPDRRAGQSRIEAFLEEPYKVFGLGDLAPSLNQLVRLPINGTTAPNAIVFQSSLLEEILPATKTGTLKNWTVTFRGSGGPSGTLPLLIDAGRKYVVSSSTATPIAGGTLFQIAIQNTEGVPVAIQDRLGAGINFTIKPPKDFLKEDVLPEGLEGDFGEVSLTFPSVTTNSSDPDGPANAAEFLRSSGAEDIMGLNLSVTNLVEGILQSSLEKSGLDFPGFTGVMSAGPINASYTLATLDLGPAMQLETEFELNWSLVVEEINFYKLVCDEVTGECSRTENEDPANVRIFWPAGHPYAADNGMSIRQFRPDGRGEVEFTNCGECALPMISLSQRESDVDVEIKYGLRPELKTTISTPFLGRVSYSAVGASAGIDGVGNIGFGPLLKDEHNFQVGDATVFDGTNSPKALESVGTGIISFPMRADGPAASDWTGRAGIPGWVTVTNGLSNWITQPGNITTGWPGQVGTTNHAKILGGTSNPAFRHPAGRQQPVTVGSMTIGSGKAINMGGPEAQNASFDLHVQNGIVENSGFINFNQDNSAALMLDYGNPGGDSSEATAVLCGPGQLIFTRGGGLRGYEGPKDFTFTNYNQLRVSQVGAAPGDIEVMDLNGPIKPIYYWDFETGTAGSRPDVFGSPATPLPGTQISNSGRTGRALRLGGGSSGLQVDDLAPLNAAASGDQITVCYWQKQDFAQQSFAFYGFSSSGRFAVHSPWDDRKVYFYGAGIGDVLVDDPAPALDVTQWHHFALVKDGGIKQIWIDGELVAEDEEAPPLDGNFDRFLIGTAGATLPGYSMVGLIDDFAVFGHALGAESIARIFSGTRPDALTRETTINNIGTISTESGTLRSSASHLINQGVIGATGTSSGDRKPAAIVLRGDRLTTRRGSEIFARSFGSTASVIVNGTETVDHAGTIRALGGGSFTFNNSSNPPRTAWKAGLSLSGDCGIFDAAGGSISLTTSDFDGGCFIVRRDSQIGLRDCNLTDSHIIVEARGNSQELDDGKLQLIRRSGEGGQPMRFENVVLENNGTLEATFGSMTNFSSTALFANNGLVEVGRTARISILPDRLDPLTDPAEAVYYYPGIANYSFSLDEQGEKQGALLGGQWHIRGEFEIVDGVVTELGGNTASTLVGSGSRLDEGELAPSVAEPSKQLSEGRPAEVALIGPGAKFSALDSLRENRGFLSVAEGAKFPSVLPATPGDLVNRRFLEVDGTSEMRIGGKFIQTDGSSTQIDAGGTFLVDSKDYQILGGSLTAGTGSIFAGGVLSSGTSLLVRAPLFTSNEISPLTGLRDSVQGFVGVYLADGLSSIASGAALELRGRKVVSGQGGGIDFPGLALTSNAGSFTLRGDGRPFAPDFSFGGNFTNTGSILLEGNGVKLAFPRRFTQNGAAARTRVGSGSVLRVQELAMNGGELIVEISARPPEGWLEENSNQAYGSGYLIPSAGADFAGRLVFDFVGKVTEGKVDIGDTWEVADRTRRITGVTGADAPVFRYNGGPIPEGWLPPGAELAVVQYEKEFVTGKDFGLAVRVVPEGGFTDYYTWASEQGLPDRITSALADPFSDGNGNGIPNYLEFFYGINGIDRSAAFIELATAPSAESGRQDSALTFLRPAGIDASYTAYVSEDLINWSLAPMEIQAITPGPGDGMERVTFASNFPAQDSALFYRIEPKFNPTNFEKGLIPTTFNSKLITGAAGLRNAEEDLGIDYDFVPGRVLYCNVTGARRSGNGGSVFGGTAEDGTRDFIYQDRSHLATAVVHAGLLEIGARGLIKVTLIDPLPTFTGSSQPALNGGGELVVSESVVAGGEGYSYKIELVRLFDSN